MIKKYKFIVVLLIVFFISTILTGCTKEEKYEYLVTEAGYYDENMIISTIEEYNNLSNYTKEEISKNNFKIDDKFFENNSLVFAHISLGTAIKIEVNKINQKGKTINIYYKIPSGAGPAIISGNYVIVKTDKNVNKINLIEE